MDERTVPIPGARSVEGTLEAPAGARNLVVECPPHPQYGGNRYDSRITAVSDSLTALGVATLRFDYGPWDEGLGEREDVRNAIRWGAERYERVGLFGYSFGGTMAVLAAGSVDVDLCAVSLLAPALQVVEGIDAEARLSAIEAPIQVIYGTRDETAHWESLVEAAEALGATVLSVSGDHFFVGQMDGIAADVGEFLATHC